uniref:Uncharacterized protein n=1 Tax=Lepeophtheirus salmonis TaxID=72036 RepID=A0A0K2TPB7_LEPSM
MKRDTSSKVRNPNPRSAKILSSIVEPFGFMDVGCEMNNLEHTFFTTDKNNKSVSSRIDLLITKSFLSDAVKAYNVIITKLLDHNAVQMGMDPQSKEIQNKKKWVLNSNIMNDPEIDDRIRCIIEDVSTRIWNSEKIFLLVKSMLMRIKGICRRAGAIYAKRQQQAMKIIESISKTILLKSKKDGAGPNL